MAADERGPTIVVGSTAAAEGLAERLTSRGETVGRIDPCAAMSPGAAFDVVVDELGAPASVVLAHLDPAAAVARPLVEHSDEQWDGAGERSVRVALQVLQHAHHHLPDGGTVVVVLPSVAAIGVPGLVPMCTAVESIRLMAKVAARRWGARGITVNVVLVPLDAFLGDLAPEGAHVPSLGPASLSGHDPLDDAAALAAMLGGPDGRALTGATLGADAGTVMQP
ncbi:SDR family oxidoreductase [Rhabdothermincola salaria]|uniref:SDR family oxidoreductase n=1 Tax=Rhabdothermincola salaria TaxID=2903142 RepID=UPI001E2F6187|nr:SDR family oxidoreductase [Rhabdothermincola salaria]